MHSAKPYIVKCRSLKKQYKLWVIGDLHLYNRSCVEEMIDELVEEIRGDPYAIWIGTGDYADCITAYDPRFDATEVAPDKREKFFEGLPSKIIEDIVDKFYPIRKKCVGLLRGNHEDKFENKFEMSLVKDVCDTIGVPYLDYCCAFDLVFKTKKEEVKFKIWAHHGAGFATTTGGKINKLNKAMSEVFDADIYCMGHTHEQMDLPRSILYQDDKGVIRQKRKLGVITGAYLATYREGCSSYGEKKLYSPVSLGSVAVTIIPDSRRLGVDKR